MRGKGVTVSTAGVRQQGGAYTLASGQRSNDTSNDEGQDGGDCVRGEMTTMSDFDSPVDFRSVPCPVGGAFLLQGFPRSPPAGQAGLAPEISDESKRRQDF